MDRVEHAANVAKASMDVVSTSALVASVMGLIQPIAALLTIVWMVIRIYESETVRKWFTKGKS